MAVHPISNREIFTSKTLIGIAATSACVALVLAILVICRTIPAGTNAIVALSFAASLSLISFALGAVLYRRSEREELKWSEQASRPQVSRPIDTTWQAALQAIELLKEAPEESSPTVAGTGITTLESSPTVAGTGITTLESSPTVAGTGITTLPPELLVNIMNRLPPRDLACCVQVCREWNKIPGEDFVLNKRHHLHAYYIRTCGQAESPEKIEALQEIAHLFALWGYFNTAIEAAQKIRDREVQLRTSLDIAHQMRLKGKETEVTAYTHALEEQREALCLGTKGCRPRCIMALADAKEQAVTGRITEALAALQRLYIVVRIASKIDFKWDKFRREVVELLLEIYHMPLSSKHEKNRSGYLLGKYMCIPYRLEVRSILAVYFANNVFDNDPVLVEKVVTRCLSNLDTPLFCDMLCHYIGVFVDLRNFARAEELRNQLKGSYRLYADFLIKKGHIMQASTLKEKEQLLAKETRVEDHVRDQREGLPSDERGAAIVFKKEIEKFRDMFIYRELFWPQLYSMREIGRYLSEDPGIEEESNDFPPRDFSAQEACARFFLQFERMKLCESITPNSDMSFLLQEHLFYLALQCGGEAPFALIRLAEYEMKTGYHERARVLLERAASLIERDQTCHPRWERKIREELSYLYAKIGEYDRALKVSGRDGFRGYLEALRPE